MKYQAEKISNNVLSSIEKIKTIENRFMKEIEIYDFNSPQTVNDYNSINMLSILKMYIQFINQVINKVSDTSIKNYNFYLFIVNKYIKDETDNTNKD